jgi:hypothetical protein
VSSPDLDTAPPIDWQDRSTRRKFAGTALGLLAGGMAYLLTLLNYGTDLTRTALGGGIFSNFFDDQARALLDGQLDMPPETLGIEGFVHDGKTYTYFPPFPALLRLPVLMTTDEFDYQLTALSMALAWIVLAVIVTKMTWFLMDRLATEDTLSVRSASLGGLFIAAATGGTFLTYDASLPWVYHEVYTWAVTAAVGALYWMVRTCLQPSRHSVFWLAVFAFVAVGSRATEGWAVCLAAIGLGVWLRFRPFTAEHHVLWWRIVLAGLLPLASSIALNLYKFDAVYMFPLKDQVWTQVNEQRQAALAANDGTLSGPQFFTTSFMAYFRPDGIRFTDHFPWITLPAEAAPAYHGAFVDQTYRTGSATAFMWLLMALLLISLVASFRPGARPELARLRFPFIGSILVTGGVMSYGYYSTRYASDLVPALVLGGAVGTALVAQALLRRPRWTAPTLAVVAFGTVFALVAQMAIGVFVAASLHRGEPLQRYVQWQGALTPDAQAELVTQVEGLPEGGSTDQLAIRGDCDALYLHTGDKYEPWVPVEERDQVWALQFDEAVSSGRARLLEVRGAKEQTIDVEVLDSREARIVARIGDRTVSGEWFEIPTDGRVTLGLRNLLQYGLYRIESTPGGPVGFVESVYFDEDWNSLPALVEPALDEPHLASLGIEVERQQGLDLPLCREVAERAGLDLGQG